VDRGLFSGAYKTGSFVRSVQGRIYSGPENKCDPRIDGRLVVLPPDTDEGNGRNGK
jgi:hypothetical protein